MHPKALLDLAAELLLRLQRFQDPADAAVAAFCRRHPALGPRERHALADTAFELLRRRALWLHLAHRGGGRLERRLAILAWRGPEPVLHAALAPDEARWLAEVSAIDRSALPAKLRHNLPDWLAGRLQAQLPDADFWALVDALDRPAPLDLRIDPLKTDREALKAALAAAGIDSAPTPFSPWGLRVAGKPALQRLSGLARGGFEVQDEGSQLLALMLGARRGEMVVDFCAGAGGKTLAIGAAMRNTGRLYAFDVSDHRLAALKPRLARSGLSNVYSVRIADERDERVRRLAGKIDRVLVDAPCSGLGTLRRSPDLKWRLSPAEVAAFPPRQLGILATAARLLKPGGLLVYATCSPLVEEDEAVAEAFERESGDAFEPQPVAPLLERAGVASAVALCEGRFLRLWPQRHSCDAFFAAAWRRAG